MIVPGTALVVFGEQRSGTTLLTQLLNTQEGLHVEIGVLTHALLDARDRGLSMTRRLRDADRARIAAAVNVGLGATRIERRLAPEGFETLGEACARAFDAIRGEARIAGTKEHAPHEAIRPLLDAGAHVLVIVRDPRDVILSHARRGNGALARRVVRWRSSTHHALSLAHPRIFVVRYEDLVRDVRETFVRIGEAFGWPLDPERAAAWRLPEGHPTNTSFGTAMPRVDEAPVERWRRFEDDPWVRFAGAWCAPVLRRLSYAEGPVMSRAELLRHTARGAAVALRRRAGDARRRVAAELPGR
ncbi:MAG: sulfotransferase [Sandaracinaceae bacterium]